MPRSSSCASAGTSSTNSRTENIVAMMANAVSPSHPARSCAGAALHSGVREALESLRTPSRRLVARGRDVHRGSWPLGVPLSRRGCSGSDGRLPPPKPFSARPKPQGRVPRTITLDGYQASHRAVRELLAEDRKLRSITARSCQYLNNVVEQDHRKHQVSPPADAGIQAVRERRAHHRWSRVDPSDWERIIRSGSAAHVRKSRSGDLERGARCLIPAPDRSLQNVLTDPSRITLNLCNRTVHDTVNNVVYVWPRTMFAGADCPRHWRRRSYRDFQLEYPRSPDRSLCPGTLRSVHGRISGYRKRYLPTCASTWKRNVRGAIAKRVVGEAPQVGNAQFDWAP
jgi:hypothetical protein